MNRVLSPGVVVVYIDEYRKQHKALVTIWHGTTLQSADGTIRHLTTMPDWESFYGPGSVPCLNLLYVSDDDAKLDPYGNQIERRSSVMHGDKQGPPRIGNCWLWPDQV